jgi:hypothetical protein
MKSRFPDRLAPISPIAFGNGPFHLTIRIFLASIILSFVFLFAGAIFKGSIQPPPTAEWVGMVFFGAQFVLILGCAIATGARADKARSLVILFAALWSVACLVVAFFSAMGGAMALANAYI